MSCREGPMRDGAAANYVCGSAMTLLIVLAACSAQPTDGDLGTYSSGTSESASGSSGAGGSATSQDAGGSPGESDAGGIYDPNVVFDWPESDPTLVCLPGTYSGQFNCQMYASGAFPSASVTGSVSFSLKQSGNGELLQIDNGTLLGTAAAAAPIEFGADLVGELDCTTDHFRADAMNGLFSDGLLLTGTFGGTLEGALDRANQTLVGTWSLGIPLQPPCVGGFSVVRLP